MPGPNSQPKGGKTFYNDHRKKGEPSVIHPELKRRIANYEADFRSNLSKISNMLHRPGSEQFHR